MNENKREMTTEALPPYALEVTPDLVLPFKLTRATTSLKNDQTVMTLFHSGRTKEALAFKVKTTQPRRYLVRPNQGIVMPGRKESVTILIIDKDRQNLLDLHDKLGKSVLDNSKDKFLVQSCIVDVEFAQRYHSLAKSTDLLSDPGIKAGKESVEALSEMWNKAAGGGATLIYNKKLQVRHVVASSFFSTPGRTVSSLSKGKLMDSDIKAIHSYSESLTPERILRRKCDDLVRCSTYIDTERNLLTNTVKQTEKNLSKEIVTCSEKKIDNEVIDANGTSLIGNCHSKGSISFHKMIMVAIFFFLIGIKVSSIRKFTEVIAEIPVFGSLLGIEKQVDVGQEL